MSGLEKESQDAAAESTASPTPPERARVSAEPSSASSDESGAESSDTPASSESPASAQTPNTPTSALSPMAAEAHAPSSDTPVDSTPAFDEVAAPATTEASADPENAMSGSANTASGSENAASGSENAASGSANTASGSENTASGSANAASGSENAASGSENAASGSANATSGPEKPAAAQPAAAGSGDTLSLRETLPLAHPQSVVIRRISEPEETAEMPLAPFMSAQNALEQSGEVSGWGSVLQRQRSSFFRQVFLWLLAISLLMSIGSGAIYYSRQLAFIQEDRQQRAELLLGYLATQAQLGAFAGDKVLLEHPVRRMTDQKDVVYVAVYDAYGKELIKSSGRSGLPPPEPPLGLLPELLQTTRLDTELAQKNKGDIFTQSVSSKVIRSRPIEKWNTVDLYAPIIISERGSPGVAPYVYPSDRLTRDRVVGVARVGLSLETASERLRDVVRWGVGLGLLLLALGATAAYFIAGRISIPILELVRGADEIRNGNLHPHIDVHRSDELGMLAESFLRMAERLRETMSALSRLNRDLESEVKRRTRQIRLAYAFTSVLNSPIDRSDEAMDAADLTVMLDQALAALVEATGTKGGGVFLDESNGEGELLVRAAYGVSTHTLGQMPSLKEVIEQRPKNAEGAVTPLQEAVQVIGRRLLVPLVFRNHPLGLLVLVLSSDEPPEQTLLEFVRQAAAQLAIAVSNARAYARLSQLAVELKLRTETLAAQRDQVKAQRDQLENQRNQLEEQRNQLAGQSIQLRIQRNQLREVNRLKSEFLANVSHELRTPLNAIMGYSELIHDELYGPISSEAHEAVGGVLASSSNLLRLINQILDLSRIEAGRMEIYFEPIDLAAVCGAVIREAEAMGRDRPYRVQLICPPNLRVETDAVKLQQILTNLIANAIKFTAQGSVQVEVREIDGGDAMIVVRDTGIGIKPEHVELIFEEFRQVDGSSTRRFGGTGLGLAIARRLAEMLGAHISVESVFGQGSVFSIRLPRTAPRPSAQKRQRDMDSNPLIGMSDPDIPRLVMPTAALLEQLRNHPQD
jgi:signal transduction histidine kinase